MQYIKNAYTATQTNNGLLLQSKGKIANPSTFIDIIKPYVNQENYSLQRLEYTKSQQIYNALLTKNEA